MESSHGSTPSRRSFVKAACLMGFCAYGSALGDRALLDGRAAFDETPGMPRKWIASLLPLMATIDTDEARRVLKRCSAAHYEDLAMDATVSRFHGDLPGFLDHLRSEWNWTVEHDAQGGVLLVNENKARCVCPLIPEEPADDLGVLCYCSEGFAERMFSAVTGGPAHAEVTESILRGGARCRYRIELGRRKA